MIASVVATLSNIDASIDTVIDAICELPCVEIGKFDHNTRRIPITIDSPNPNAIEDTTRQLQQCSGIAFVDVVFVHFEDEEVRAASLKEEAIQS